MTAKEDLDLLISEAREDLFAFMGLVHETDMDAQHGGQAVPAAHHLKMLDVLTDEEIRTAVILAPRDAAKTTLVQGYLEWKLGRASRSGDKRWANRFRALYVSATAAQAYRVSNGIRETIENNPMYQAIFPDVKPHTKKWGEEEWKVRGNTIKDANFTAMGMDGPSVGTRANVIILDDISDEKNTLTPTQRERVHGKLTEVISPIAKFVPNSRMIMVATRWHWEDGVRWAQEEGWTELRIEAIQEDDEGNEVSYWPERVPLETLQEMRRRRPKEFARQYQNEVVPDEGLVFERAWFEPRFDYLPSEVRWVVCSWDTAHSEGRNRSYSAGWSAVVTKDFHVYLFRLTRGQVPYPYLKQAIKRQALDDGAQFVIIEKKSSGHSAVQEFVLDPEMRHRIVEWQPFGQKGSPSRLDANERVSDIGQQRRIHLPSEYFMRKHSASWLPEAEKELFSYPEGESDDAVDALCQMLYWVEDRRVEWEARKLRTRPGAARWVTPTGPQWKRVAI